MGVYFLEYHNFFFLCYKVNNLLLRIICAGFVLPKLKKYSTDTLSSEFLNICGTYNIAMIL